MIATIQHCSGLQDAAPRLVATHRCRKPPHGPNSDSSRISKPVAQDDTWHKKYPVAQDGMGRKAEPLAQDCILFGFHGNSEDVYSNIFYYILLHLIKLIRRLCSQPLLTSSSSRARTGSKPTKQSHLEFLSLYHCFGCHLDRPPGHKPFSFADPQFLSFYQCFGSQPPTAARRRPKAESSIRNSQFFSMFCSRRLPDGHS